MGYEEFKIKPKNPNTCKLLDALICSYKNGEFNKYCGNVFHLYIIYICIIYHLYWYHVNEFTCVIYIGKQKKTNDPWPGEWK